MQNILEQEHELRAFDVDISGHFMPSAILVKMQEIAEDHAALAGFGRVKLGIEKNIAWVLTRLSLEMHTYPKLGEKIKLVTYPVAPSKLSFTRYFKIEDALGKELGKAVSIWILFDTKRRTLLRPTVLGEQYPYDPSLPSIMDAPSKILMPSNMEYICERAVMYSETDVNRHMNNAKYANWVCELFENDFITEHKIKKLKINYVSEAHIGQLIELYTFAQDDINTIIVRGKTGEKTVFDAAVDFFI